MILAAPAEGPALVSGLSKHSTPDCIGTLSLEMREEPCRTPGCGETLWTVVHRCSECDKVRSDPFENCPKCHVPAVDRTWHGPGCSAATAQILVGTGRSQCTMCRGRVKLVKPNSADGSHEDWMVKVEFCREDSHCMLPTEGLMEGRSGRWMKQRSPRKKAWGEEARHPEPQSRHNQGPPRSTASTSLPASPQILFDEGDVERQLAWHQNRLQSRLDAHQRRILADLARFHRSDLYKLSAIRVVGGHHTRPEFLSELFGPLLGDGQERTLPEIFKCSDELHDKLAKLGIFSHLQVSLAASKDNPWGIDALVNVVERGRFFLKTSTDVGNGEGALTGLARARNLCGRAEVLEATVGLGNKTRASCQVRAEAPLWAARARAELALNASERDLSGFASCSETVKGVAAKLKTETGYGAHELTYELATRTIGSLLPGASDSRPSHCPGFETHETQSVFPTKGSLLKFIQEYAGVFGQANYVKSTLESAISRPLFNTPTIVSLGFQCGFIHPLAGGPAPFNDRFQLGGPTNTIPNFLRSHSKPDAASCFGCSLLDDYMGGEKYWAGGLSVLAPVPGKAEWPLKLHGFINAGSLINDWHTLRSQKPSIGIGLGLVGSIQDVRVEANVGMPLVAQKGDGARRGLQVGLGIGFLS
ncbi:uncharacterized protein PGTG_09706 [Puccinia graminis f. sp. tritici CRL 75-36-700-3]|uniref:Bacterial surface antigen (D15) domain-containing protein n=1 Tax=Puccinia graminis f. sp. tritici (strain CRL 75-36-700-3 / race SCCL) TaxID=418459 RepID=E3KI68_PUCGT|nr:uncharacterized protein PGTG_09706 [Puccinia graminis f. sp. tritici CRL 75-36-700-3]EFP83993.2 hypothetical protein PGTG_09706 [Puccinia graminis f. sp. tritici CRL 75-36-700-3]